MKKIYEKILNSKMEVVDEVYEFIDTNAHYETIVNLYKETLEGFSDDDYYDCLCDIYYDEYICEIATRMTAKANRDMRKYLNMDDHKLCGNFNNIEYDYPKMLYDFTDGKIGEKTFTYNRELLNAMISRLNNGEDSPEAEIDRKILEQWYWDTFGTWGITYNLSEEMSSFLYDLKMEDEEGGNNLADYDNEENLYDWWLGYGCNTLGYYYRAA